MSFSEANQSSSSHQESRQLATFQEEATESCGFSQTNKSVKTSSMKSSSTMNQSSSSSFQSSSRAQVESSNQSSSMSSMSSSKTMTSSSSFQSGFTKQVWREITIDPSIKSILFVLLTTDVFMVYSLSLSLSLSINCNFSGKSDFQCWVETDWKSTSRDSARQSENSDCLCHHWPRGWQRLCWLW